MTQLLNEPQTFEAISKTRPKEGEANVVEHKTSSSSGSKNKKRKNIKGGSGAQPKKGTKGKGKKNNPKDKKPKGSVSIAGLKVTGRETVTSISPNLRTKRKVNMIFWFQKPA